jgi:hypothetical protein
LAAEKQLHQQTKTTLENSVKTERKERITVLLDNAIGDGRITAAQRPQWAQELENSFDGKSKELATLKPGRSRRESVTGDQGQRRIQIENQQERTCEDPRSCGCQNERRARLRPGIQSGANRERIAL